MCSHTWCLICALYKPIFLHPIVCRKVGKSLDFPFEIKKGSDSKSENQEQSTRGVASRGARGGGNGSSSGRGGISGGRGGGSGSNNQVGGRLTDEDYRFYLQLKSQKAKVDDNINKIDVSTFPLLNLYDFVPFSRGLACGAVFK